MINNIMSGTASACLCLLGFLSPLQTNAQSIAQNPSSKEWVTPIRNMENGEYVDDPDKSLYHPDKGSVSFDELSISRNEQTAAGWDLVFSDSKSNAVLTVSDIDLLSWMPTVPQWARADSGLFYISLVNQEFNRQQVRLEPAQYSINIPADSFSRVDLARNCLNAGLWEAIAYKSQDGKNSPVWHGWFDFPDELYGELFEQKSHLSYESYSPFIKNYPDLGHPSIDLTKIRTEVADIPIESEVKNNTAWPLKGEWKKKYSNIVQPKNPKSISDLLTDKAEFATFAPPGLYLTNQPKHTQLGKLAKVQSIAYRKVRHKADNQVYDEIEITYENPANGEITHLIIGGFSAMQLPQLPEEQADHGWKMPMGIGDHGFYESYALMQSSESRPNAYYAMLLDDEGHWLDSHMVGIDGPLLYRDEKNPNELHIWLLAFERHAPVGHYTITMGGVHP